MAELASSRIYGDLTVTGVTIVSSPTQGDHAANKDYVDSNFYTESEIDAFLASKSDTGHTHTEADITNLDHYNSSDFTADFNSKSTSNLSEGTNLYYTTTRANSAIDTRVSKPFVDALGIDAATLGDLAPSYFTNRGNHTGTQPLSSISDHTKANHDSLNIDADTVDGQHASAFATTSHDHAAADITSGTIANDRISAVSVQMHITKTYVDSLNVDADTLDGQDASAFAEVEHSHGNSSYFNNIGNGVDTVIPVVHNLDTTDLIVQIQHTDTTTEVAYATYTVTDANTITLTFASPPATGSVRVLILAGPYTGVQGNVMSDDITRIVKLTQAEYNALNPPNGNTLYVVVD